MIIRFLRWFREKYKDALVSLDEIERIDPYVKQLLKQSEILDITKYYIDFLNLKASDLRQIHEKQDEDILSLILG